MSEVKITFYKCIRDKSDYTSDDEHMLSRLYMVIDVDGQISGSHYCRIKHSLDGVDDADGNIEVGPPIDIYGNLYMGLMDYKAFEHEATKYYKAVLDSASGGPHIMRSHDNIYMYEHSIVLKAGPNNN